MPIAEQDHFLRQTTSYNPYNHILGRVVVSLPFLRIVGNIILYQELVPCLSTSRKNWKKKSDSWSTS